MTQYYVTRDAYDEESEEFERKTKEYGSLGKALEIVENVMNAPRKNGFIKVLSHKIDEESDTITFVIDQIMSDHMRKKTQ